MSPNKKVLSQNGEKKLIFSFFFYKTQMFEFYHYLNFGNVCIELKMPLPTDFAADFRYRSPSLLVSQLRKNPSDVSMNEQTDRLTNMVSCSEANENED